MNGHGHIFGDGHFQNHAMLASIFRHIRDAVCDGLARAADGNGLAVERDFSGIGGGDAEKDARQFCAPRADKPGEADDLTGVEVEVERLDQNLKELLLDIAWEVGLDNLTVISPLIYTRDEIENSPHRSSPIIKIIAQEGVRV